MASGGTSWLAEDVGKIAGVMCQSNMSKDPLRIKLTYKGTPSDPSSSDIKIWSDSRVADSWNMMVQFTVPERKIPGVCVWCRKEDSVGAILCSADAFLHSDLENTAAGMFLPVRSKGLLRNPAGIVAEPSWGVFKVQALELHQHIVFGGSKSGADSALSFLPDSGDSAFLELKFHTSQIAPLPHHPQICCVVT
jgi:hypothetical protein